MTEEKTGLDAKAKEHAKPKPAKRNPAKAKAPLDLAKLRDLIADIEANNQRMQRVDLLARLTAEHGLKMKDTGAALQVTLAGVKASGTAGEALALSNWCNAARRQLLDAGAV